MERAHGAELVWVIASVIVVAAVALFAAPFPPLLDWTRSAGWSRGIEFIVLLPTSWMLLSGIGFVRAKVQINSDGMSVERLQAGEQPFVPVAELAGELKASQRENLHLMQRLAALEAKLAAIETSRSARPEPRPESSAGDVVSPPVRVGTDLHGNRGGSDV